MQLLAEVKVPKTWILFNKKLLAKKKQLSSVLIRYPDSMNMQIRRHLQILQAPPPSTGTLVLHGPHLH